MNSLVDSSRHNRYRILAFTVVASEFGVHSMFQLPIDHVRIGHSH